MMKKYISAVIAALMILVCMSSCGNSTAGQSSEQPKMPQSEQTKQAQSEQADASPSEQTEKLQIVTTIFPEYDWVKQVLGENAENADVTLLLDNGVDLHSYQPSAEDILNISTCDMFIYVGGESDEWVEDALEEASNKDMVVINLLEVLGDNVKEEELVDGMEHEDEDEHEEEEEGEADEHVWLSLKNAGVLCGSISDGLCSIDSEHSDVYKQNAKNYMDKLSELDAQYQEAVGSASVKTLLFADRFPFRYMVDDYGLDYYAAFSGCSAETEASFETIVFLANKVDELNLSCVLTIEKSGQKIADTVIQNTQSKDQQILALDSMQSTTSKDVSDGATYLSIMEKNLDVLKEALK